MEIDDLRDYLDILEEYEELQRIGVEAGLEGDGSDHAPTSWHPRRAAALFENVKGYPKGFRALGALGRKSSRPLSARTALTYVYRRAHRQKKVSCRHICGVKKSDPAGFGEDRTLQRSYFVR